MKQKWIYLALIVLLLYLSPYFILGENTHVRIHDNLDSNITWYKVLADSGTMFASPDTKIPNIMNGLPRNSLGSELNLMVLLYAFFKPFTAYTINQVLMRVLAFFGMYLLLKKHVFIKKTRRLASPILIVGTALAYAMLPYWPSGGGSIAGLPLALYAFLNIRNREASKADWAILVLLPFYSDFILSFVFFLTCMSMVWLVDWIRTKRFNFPFFAAMALMTIMYLIINYRIIYQMFLNPDFTSHRVAFDRGHWNTVYALAIAVGVFIFGFMHVIRLTQWIVLPTILAAFVIAHKKRINIRLLTGCFVLNIVFSLIYGLYKWEGIKPLKEKWHIFEMFNFGRFQFLEPPVWYISFALALWVIWKSVKWGKQIAMVLLSAQIVVLFLFGEDIHYRHHNYVSFAQFYSEDLLREIRDYIGKPPSTYRVVSIGIHPSIAQYNGFYTLDGYVVSYPLSYKKQFRKIIAPELRKDTSNRHYFDHWGSRCYIFVHELRRHHMYAHGKKIVKHLNLNTRALKQMGGTYIFSAVKIANAKENGLNLLRSFENQTSPWKIYLYRVE